MWDPRAHYYPWLCDPRPIPFRYGDYRSLRKPYGVADYRADSAGWRVERGVYVEAEWDPRDPLGEMNFIAEVRKDGFPTVAIAQAWLHHDDCAAVLEGQARHPFVRGIRHKPKPGMMDDAKWRQGYARLAPLGLHFELQTPWRQLEEAARLARDFPGTALVLNHTGLPDEDHDGWSRAMSALAACPNVAVKISGLGMVDHHWTVESIRPFVLKTVDMFGTERCLFASNFPVDRLYSDYAGLWRAFDMLTTGFSADERAGLFHDNALRLYRL